MWREVGQVDLDAVLVQLDLEFRVIDVAFHKQITRCPVDYAIRTDLSIKASAGVKDWDNLDGDRL